MLPEPVRPPSGPALSPFPLPHYGTDTRLVEESELSRWTPGETPIEPGTVDCRMVMKEPGKVNDSYKSADHGGSHDLHETEPQRVDLGDHAGDEDHTQTRHGAE